MKLARPTLSTLGILALGACADAPTATTTPMLAGATVTASAESAPGGRYIVRLNGRAARFDDRVASLGGKVEWVHEGAGLAIVSGLDAAGAGSLAAASGVAEVVADVVATRDEVRSASPIALAEVASEGGIASQANPAGAILYPFQWNMRAIDADEAWAAGKLGSPTVTIAILDSGIDYTSLDLNGLVDLSRSTSFVPSDDAIIAANFPGRHVVDDLHGHGTNVATQAASTGFVFAGVSSRSTLIGVKVTSASGSGALSGMLQGVLWAADKGADVINMSLQAGFTKGGGAGPLVSLLNGVLRYAERAGAVVVVAAGNSAIDLDRNSIPTAEGPAHAPSYVQVFCDMPNVVCVSATGPVTSDGSPDVPAFYTNYGRSAISVAAPGGNAGATVTTWPWGPDQVSWVWSMCARNALPNPATPAVRPCASGLLQIRMAGTSQASPHVAGLAALLVAEQGKGKPAQIKAAIQKGAEDRGQPGTDPFFGKGRINVARSLGL